MDPMEALHHAARQYCIEHTALWQERYLQLGAAGEATVPIAGGKWSYTREAYNVFPRYQTLEAIQSEVERFLPDDFVSLDECRTLLAMAGETAQSRFTKQTDPTAVAADLDERRQFATFVLTVGESQLSEQKRLPFRRVLGIAEHKALHDAVVQRWGKWYGGDSDRTNSDSEVITLHDAAMEHPDSYMCLRAALREHGVKHVFELREYGDGCEIPIESAGYTYNGAEGFWTSRDLGWLVYASHESSITFASAWLVERMRTALPEFERYIYKGWDRAAYA